MIDFILAGLLYTLLMFFAFSFLSFMIIGLTYTMVAGLKRFFHIFKQPNLVLNQHVSVFPSAYWSAAEIPSLGHGCGVSERN